MGGRFAAIEVITPTSRSRFAQPPRRCPMPGANESSTVEWHKAQVMPMETSAPPLSNRHLHADHRVELEQRQRRRRVVEIHRALLDLVGERRGQGLAVDLQTDAERRLRADTAADATVLVTGDCAMELDRIG